MCVDVTSDGISHGVCLAGYWQHLRAFDRHLNLVWGGTHESSLVLVSVRFDLLVAGVSAWSGCEVCTACLNVAQFLTLCGPFDLYFGRQDVLCYGPN